MIELNQEEAEALVIKMLNKLYRRDAFLLQKKLNLTERAITHKMGVYLQQFAPKNLDVDCEFNRMGKNISGEIDYTDGDYFAKTVCLSKGLVPDDDDMGSRVFPDIIVHERGKANNYIIIEVKIDWKNGKAEHDIKKLKAYKDDLKYQFAFFVQLTEKRKDVKISHI